MIERGLYYATAEFAQMIKDIGGTWNDNLYWAIPMGKLNHRNQVQQKRLNFYLNLPERDIRSCYYHIGRTTSKSIFFISTSPMLNSTY